MYCVQCGVQLADSQKVCPLCGTVVFHPELTQPQGEPLYPAGGNPHRQKINRHGILVILTAIFLLPILVTLLVDLQIHGRVTWSGYAMGAIALGYISFVLPFWFRKYYPVIFVPVDFGVLGLYLLYIDLDCGGRWFLSFAFPMVGALGLIVTAVVVLTHYLRRGYFFIYGGAAIALGAVMPLMEYLMLRTFHFPRFYAWSLYPLIALMLLGGVLIYLGVSNSAREAMERKLFL